MWSTLLNWKFWLWLVGVSILTPIFLTLGIYSMVLPKLPSVESLKDVQFQVPLRIYSRDERMIAEFGETKRTPLNIEDVPKDLIHAVLSAEDDNFYEHLGVDFKGLMRAVVVLLKTGEKGQGGSTITMQVARNFFLSNEKTYQRKLDEILLSFKIERKLTKDQILELYLNKIYLGNRSYGFAAAAQVYYGKQIQDLAPAQIAMLAGLPKAPSRYNPIVNRKRAILRRDYVLNRMNKLGYLDDAGLKKSLDFVDDSRLHGLQEEVSAPYIAEMVRSEMFERFKTAAYTSGFRVYTSVNSRLQNAAAASLRAALLEYTERHGYRGAEVNVPLAADSTEDAWAEILAEYSETNKLWPALVLDIADKSIQVYQPTYGKLLLKWENLSWASAWNGDGKAPGASPKTAADIVKRGDIIRVTQLPNKDWRLAQVPDVEGALVSLSPDDGGLMALVGGFNFSASNFNRVLQAERQPGSNLKPFIYSSALEKGYTAASLINDAPVVFDDPGLESAWRPENYSGQVFGPTRLRVALMKSRNLVSIRLLRDIGIGYAIENLVKFGFRAEKLPRDLSLALGSAAVTPMELVTGYAVFANGGYKVEPYFIDRIETEEGEVLYRKNPTVVCQDCDPVETGESAASPLDASPQDAKTLDAKTLDVRKAGQPNTAPTLAGAEPKRYAKRMVPAQNVYIMTSIMQDVIKQGTAVRALQLKRGDIAGKTGTTNDQHDAWFSGFSPDVVTTAWVGFDSPKPLGDDETGGRAALPMWMDYMSEALKEFRERYHERPPGLVTVKIDPDTGLVVGGGNPNGQFEIFLEGTVPESADESSPSMNPNEKGGRPSDAAGEDLF